ncbi:hypothetical protein K458DRAFT_411137 [Lentithecium fluviatile CBS 122367]|uniref:Uncharacterized protein n=1 Tax=Lentithecium fluviatile CBS 122367 TaxID=1168545 RepID=A0A6G1JML2_9PLEO|nr:hypothetical protein K458DRAFT_411137 [Lentithecium fluviatile CBS 122367]
MPPPLIPILPGIKAHEHGGGVRGPSADLLFTVTQNPLTSRNPSLRLLSRPLHYSMPISQSTRYISKPPNPPS